MPGLPVAFAPLARNDIISIGRHIAEDNEAAANRFRIALTARCLKLGVSGRSHRLRPELGEGVRAVSFGRYLIIFTVLDDRVRIERVVHSARNLSDILKPRSI